MIWNYYGDRVISHTTKVMLQILQDRFQQYLNQELSDVQDGLRKGRGKRDQIANILWNIQKSNRIAEKYLFHWLYGSQEIVENS